VSGAGRTLFGSFARREIALAGVTIHTLVGGQGPPLLLLHGYPQTHACWHALAPALAEHYTVVLTDLRGYGASSKPASDDAHEGYAKRTMARDQVAVMRALGFERFFICGHDRGGRVAYRLALDSPSAVAKLAVLDIVPTLETFERLDRDRSLATYHWFFLAQPPDFPERMIGCDPDFFLLHTLAAWSAPGFVFASEALAAYRDAFRDPEMIRATCEDYRAGITVDCAHDAADRAAGRTIDVPLLVLWGAGPTTRDVRLSPLDVWRAWARDVRGRALPCGHFLPEERPVEVAAELVAFFGPATREAARYVQ
jgi:haloacetate dehalogenase